MFENGDNFFDGGKNAAGDDEVWVLVGQAGNCQLAVLDDWIVAVGIKNCEIMTQGFGFGLETVIFDGIEVGQEDDLHDAYYLTKSGDEDRDSP